MTFKNRGRSKKTEGRTRPKSRGGSLAVGTYLQRGSAPPPPPRGSKLRVTGLSGGELEAVPLSLDCRTRPGLIPHYDQDDCIQLAI